MVAYDFICTKCGEIAEFDENPSDIPEIEKCPGCKGKMVRYWGHRAPAIHIPEGFAETQINYDQSPSGKKHFF